MLHQERVRRRRDISIFTSLFMILKTALNNFQIRKIPESSELTGHFPARTKTFQRLAARWQSRAERRISEEMARIKTGAAQPSSSGSEMSVLPLNNLKIEIF